MKPWKNPLSNTLLRSEDNKIPTREKHKDGTESWRFRAHNEGVSCLIVTGAKLLTGVDEVGGDFSELSKSFLLGVERGVVEGLVVFEGGSDSGGGYGVLRIYSNHPPARPDEMQAASIAANPVEVEKINWQG